MVNGKNLVAVLSAMLLASAGCGDDDDDDGGGSGKGGASGSSGSSSAGSGGASGGSGGSGAGSGGSGGNQSMNPAECPATAPASDAACTVIDLECEYGEMECDCDEQGGAMALTWDCSTNGPPPMQMCPAAEPAGGSACEEGRGDCEFGSRICDCVDDLWACWDPADCPATPPAVDSACNPVGMECPYGDGECECEDSGWDCDDDVTGMPDIDAGA